MEASTHRLTRNVKVAFYMIIAFWRRSDGECAVTGHTHSGALYCSTHTHTHTHTRRVALKVRYLLCSQTQSTRVTDTMFVVVCNLEN